MTDIKDIRLLIIFILIADLIGILIYGLKGNIVGIFNCVSWSVVSGFVLLNLKTLFNKK